MNNEVNLIANRKKSAAEQDKIIKGLNIAAFVSLGIVVICAVILFFLNQSANFSDLSQKEKATLAGLALSDKKIAKYLVVQARLKEISTILNSRTSYDKTISDIAAGIPSELEVNSFSLNKQDVAIVVSSSSLQAVNTFLSYMVDMLNNKKIFRSISLNGVSADPKNNKYTLVLDAKFL